MEVSKVSGGTDSAKVRNCESNNLQNYQALRDIINSHPPSPIYGNVNMNMQISSSQNMVDLGDMSLMMHQPGMYGLTGQNQDNQGHPNGQSLRRYAMSKGGVGITRQEIPQKSSTLPDRQVSGSGACGVTNGYFSPGPTLTPYNSRTCMERGKQESPLDVQMHIALKQHQQQLFQQEPHTPQQLTPVVNSIKEDLSQRKSTVMQSRDSQIDNQRKCDAKQTSLKQSDVPSSLINDVTKITNVTPMCEEQDNEMKTGQSELKGYKETRVATIPSTTTPTTTTVSTDSVAKMPIITTVTTSTISACTFQANLHGTSASGTRTDSVFMTKMIVDESEGSQERRDVKEKKRDRKRKAPEEKREGETENESKKCNPSSLMEKILAEVVGVKMMVGKLEHQTEHINATVQQMQAENIAWKNKLAVLEQDMGDVKDSINLAHSLIKDEAEARKQCDSKMNSEMNDRKKEISNNVHVLKCHYSDIKQLSKDVRENKQAVEKLEKPMKEMKQQLKRVTGDTEYPVQCTVVAQWVWYEENENILDVTKLIVNETLNLNQVNVIRAERKSGQHTGSGLVKIEVGSEDEVKLILGQK